ncbi:hypothetical protein BC833DRAFT_95143 [Globomyces pollinis-pini]|nr:hypothetical protein BC833DRAFT_95143 [Globomyces pollinis-pini]
MQSQLISKLDHIRQLEDDRIVFEQQFRTEMTTQKRLVELCETRTRESTEETDRLKILLEETKSELASVRNDQAVNATEHQNTHKELKDYIEKLELEREKLSSELSMINKEMIDRSQSEQLSQSAAIFDRLKKSGKSFTEMYSDYTRLQHELLKEKSEVARLNDCVSQIVADIDQRAQTMIQINQDYQRAKQINENLSLSLSKVTKEKNDAMEELNSMKDKVASLENEISLLNKDSSDKYRQIQALLREQEVLKGGLDKYEELTESFSDQSGADLIISQRLVTYRNIEELQSQNQTLLRSLRSLSNKMEKQEELLLKQAEEERVTAWTERIAIVTDLQEKLERATRNCESFARERDQWKRVAGNRASDDQHVVEVHRNESTVDYESIYRELQREFDIYRKECGTDTKLMRKQMEELQLERTELKINVAQLNNQIVYLNDRHQLQLQNLETKTRDFEELRKQLQLMNVTANKQDLKIDELNSSLTTCRNTLDTFAAEKQQLEIERQIWKASEARCAAQIQDLQQQRNSSHDRVKELQSFWEEKDKKAGIQLKKLEDQIESLNRELQLSRKQLSDVMDDHRTLLAKRDTLVRETQSKLEKLVSLVSFSKIRESKMKS